MSNPTDEITLWLLRAQYFLSRVVRVRLLASILLFYAPIVATGYYLNYRFGTQVFTRGIHMALLWLGIAPWLVQLAFEVLRRFFDDNRDLFEKLDDWRSQRTAELQLIQSPRYLIFGVPWTLLTTTIAVVKVFGESSLAIKIWACCAFGALFIVTAVGFWGIFVVISLMSRLVKRSLHFNPYHPDRFGGMTDVGRFSVKGALLFSSGSLIFPLAFEISATAGGAADLLTTGLYFCMAAAFVTILGAFFIPIFTVKAFVDPTKTNMILESRRQLDARLARLQESEVLDVKSALDLFAHFYIKHRPLEDLRDYPFDLKVILELLSSLIIPIAVAIMEIVL